MPFRFRRSLSLGPLRLAASKRGVTPSVRAGRVSVSRRGVSVRLARGLSWFSGRR